MGKATCYLRCLKKPWPRTSWAAVPNRLLLDSTPGLKLILTYPMQPARLLSLQDQWLKVNAEARSAPDFQRKTLFFYPHGNK